MTRITSLSFCSAFYCSRADVKYRRHDRHGGGIFYTLQFLYHKIIYSLKRVGRIIRHGVGQIIVP